MCRKTSFELVNSFDNFLHLKFACSKVQQKLCNKSNDHMKELTRELDTRLNCEGWP